MRAWLALGLCALWACGDDDVAGAEGEPDANVPAPSPDADPVDAGEVDAAPPTPELALDPWSPEAFARLSVLQLERRARHTSSADPSGGNADYGHALDQDAQGDAVLWDRRGAGSLRRLWVTGFSSEQRLRMRFDDEPTARIDATLGALFSGSVAPFLAPLVLDDQASSGGFVSLLPLPYERALRITVSGPVRYFDIDGYDLPAAPTFSSTEETSTARAFLARAGIDPKPAADDVEISDQLDLDPGGEYVLADLEGPRSLAAIELRLPGVFPLAAEDSGASSSEDGRSVAQRSSFELAVEPDNYGVTLRRLIDYGVADQRVQLWVDGVAVGAWSTPGADPVARLRWVGFSLPEALTRGKSKLRVRLEALAGPWTELRIEARSHTDRGRLVTDQLDVGDAAAESAHDYLATAATRIAPATLRQPTWSELAARLAGVWLRIAWDGEAQPSVDAPIEALCAIGAFGPGLARGLGAGMREDGTLYLFFPMPFPRHARVSLHHAGSEALTGLRVWIRHRALLDANADHGTFSTAYSRGASSEGRDLHFLQTEGAGQVVALVQSMRDTASRGFMQGDERIYVDGARTPAVQGTGTEDFYNGGFYFRSGPFAQATHGEASHVRDGALSGTAMYRQLLTDPIPYRSGLVLGIEHGADNAVPVEASLFAAYYRAARPRLRHSDSVQIGDSASELAHGYRTEQESWRGSNTFTFEGDDDDVPWTLAGCSHRGSRFELAVDPANVGVTLRRTFDQLQPQRAEIWVDGARAGLWWTAEHNAVHRFREEDWDVPVALSVGKSRLQIEVRVPGDAPAWSDYQLQAWSRLR